MFSSEIKRNLKENGYCLIPIFPQERAEFYLERIYDRFETFYSGFDRKDPKTWQNDYLPANINGFYQHYRLGHEQFIWDLRTEPGIINSFAKLYGTKDLLVSFEGLTFAFPQNKKIQKRILFDNAIRGYLNLVDSGNEDGGLIIKNRKVNCQAGDLVLWDARIGYQEDIPRKDKWRVAVYICMMPSILASKEELIKKRKAFSKLRITDHNPCQIKLIREKKDNFPVISNSPVLNEIGLKLAGFGR